MTRTITPTAPAYELIYPQDEDVDMDDGTKADAEEMALFLPHRGKMPYIIIKSKIAIPKQFTSSRPLQSFSASERKIRAPEYTDDYEHLHLDNLTQTKTDKPIKQLVEENAE